MIPPTSRERHFKEQIVKSEKNNIQIDKSKAIKVAFSN